MYANQPPTSRLSIANKPRRRRGPRGDFRKQERDQDSECHENELLERERVVRPRQGTPGEHVLDRLRDDLDAGHGGVERRRAQVEQARARWCR